jgi:hypothetical protein
MRALLDLISNVKDLRVIVRIVTNQGGAIEHKTHKRTLDDQIILDAGFKTNFGGYGSFSRLNVGPKFSGSWVISGIELPKGKNFCNLRVFFNGEAWTTPLTKLKELVKKFGGELVDDCAKAQLVVNSDGTLLLESTNQLSIHESILHRLSPFSPEIKTKKKPVHPLTGDAVGIWKLISSRDRSSIDQGVALAAALPSEIEQLLCNCEVSDSGELHRGVDVGIHLREILGSDGSEHCLDVGFGRRDIMTGEFAGDFGRVVGQLGHGCMKGFERVNGSRNRPPSEGGGIRESRFRHKVWQPIRGLVNKS